LAFDDDVRVVGKGLPFPILVFCISIVIIIEDEVALQDDDDIEGEKADMPLLIAAMKKSARKIDLDAA